MTNSLFMCLFVICISTFIKYLFKSVTDFFNWVFFFDPVLLSCRSLYILDVSPLLDICFANFFSGCSLAFNFIEHVFKFPLASCPLIH